MPVKRHLPQAFALAAVALWGVAVVTAPAHGAQAAAPAAAPAQASAAPAAAPAAGTADLARGKQTFEALCSGCHEPTLATSLRNTRQGWEALVDRMAGFGLTASDAQRKDIIDYLAATYPAQ